MDPWLLPSQPAPHDAPPSLIEASDAQFIGTCAAIADAALARVHFSSTASGSRV